MSDDQLNSASEDTAEQAAAEESAETQTEESAQLAAADELQKLRREADDAQDRALRTQAELENFRRRTQREVDDIRRYQSLPVIRDLLPGLDNLRRAVTAAEQSGDLQNLLDGIRMVTQQFEDVLKTHSAEPIRPEGQTFDPNLHEALSQVPSAEHPPMTVMQVVETGYKIHDRVVRPAKVIVTCAPPAPADTSSGDAD